jgi:hypothetical protein
VELLQRDGFKRDIALGDLLEIEEIKIDVPKFDAEPNLFRTL